METDSRTGVEGSKEDVSSKGRSISIEYSPENEYRFEMDLSGVPKILPDGLRRLISEVCHMLADEIERIREEGLEKK